MPTDTINAAATTVDHTALTATVQVAFPPHPGRDMQAHYRRYTLRPDTVRLDYRPAPDEPGAWVCERAVISGHQVKRNRELSRNRVDSEHLAGGFPVEADPDTVPNWVTELIDRHRPTGTVHLPY